MKLSNIFKKTAKTVVKTKIEKLEKNQLEKVAGGVEAVKTVVDPTRPLFGGAIGS